MKSYDLQVHVHSNPVRTFEHEGMTFIEGRKGSKFTLVVSNNTMDRVMVVPTVDGLSVLTGKPAQPGGGGYIVGPWSKLEVPGWRVDDTKVAAFVFKGKDGSYAKAATGSAANAGVIGCAIYREKAPAFTLTTFYNPTYRYRPVGEFFFNSQPPPLNDHTITCEDGPIGAASASCWAGEPERGVGSNVLRSRAVGPSGLTKTSAELNAGSQFNLGTGFGEAKDSAVTRVVFDAEATAAAVLLVYYDDRTGLTARGIRLNRSKPALPHAFPSSYCQPPAGWRG